MAMAFSVLQALPSQRRVALSVGRSLSKLKYTTIVQVNKSETLSKIFLCTEMSNKRLIQDVIGFFVSFPLTLRLGQTGRRGGGRYNPPPSDFFVILSYQEDFIWRLFTSVTVCLSLKRENQLKDIAEIY